MSKREQDKEARRQAILDAAKKIFAEKGFHNTSVSDIVQEVGIAQGTFYLYFEDKKAIFTEIVESLTKRLFKLITIENIQQVRSIGDLEGGYERVSAPLVAYFKENKDLAKIFLREAIGAGLGFEEKINQFYDRLIEMGVAYIGALRKSGVLKGDYNPRTAMTFLIGGSQMIIYRWITESLDVTEEEIVKSVRDLALNLMQ